MGASGSLWVVGSLANLILISMVRAVVQMIALLWLMVCELLRMTMIMLLLLPSSSSSSAVEAVMEVGSENGGGRAELGASRIECPRRKTSQTT